MSLNITPINATGSGAPSGPAGGALTGTYPNPTLVGVAAGQVLYGVSPGVAGSEGALTWDAVNDRLAILSAVGPNATVRSTGVGSMAQLAFLRQSDAGNRGSVGYSNTLDHVFLGNATARVLNITQNNTVLMGTDTDDGTNRLQVAGSVAVGGIVGNNTITTTRTGANPSFLRFGAFTDKPAISFSGAVPLGFEVDGGASLMSLSTAGVFEVRNQTATTGVTQLLVRAGAGQGSTNLLSAQNVGGTVVSGITSLGDFFGNNTFLSIRNAGATLTEAALGNFASYIGASFANGRGIAWSSTTDAGGTKDSGLARNAAGVLEINNGTAGTFRDLYLRGTRNVGVTVANLPTASGNAGMRATVTDANATTIGTTVAGGGANTVLVWSNGTNWRIYAN